MNENIRPFAPCDWEEVNLIYQQGLDTNLATFQTTCPTFEEWDKSHLSIGRYVYVQDGHVVGWAALTPVSSRCVYSGVAEVSVYIADFMRYKGVGTQLLKKVIEASEAHGIWTLQSGIIAENTASISLHKKCGFREVGYREKIARDSRGEWRNTVLLERRSALI